MRFWIALVALLALASSAAEAAPPRDWSTNVTMAPDGAYRIGNPQAKVKLVEYLSYTCPHCAHFARESQAGLEGGFVRSGSTLLELRPLAYNQLELLASLIARCPGARGFDRMHHAIFAGQDGWLSRGLIWIQNNAQRFALDPMPQQLHMTAQASGLLDLATANGLSAQQVDACLANPAELHRVAAIATSAQAIKYTPTFVVNGKSYDNLTWDKLVPVLKAADAR